MRRLALRASLGAFVLGLIWAGVSLQGIFGRERGDARAAVRARARLLTQYARQSLAEALRGRLAASAEAFERALRDPLAPDARLLRVRDAERSLPRPRRPLPGLGTPAADLCRLLLSDRAAPPAGPPEGPWARRLGLQRALFAALAAGDRAGVEDTFRALLAHRARFQLSAARDLPLMLAVLRRLVDAGDPDPALLRLVLLEGVTGREGAHVEGLQRTLIRRRGAFTRPDFDLLAARVRALSERGRVPVEELTARLAEGPVVPPAEPCERPELRGGGAWYVEPRPHGLDGLRIDLSALLDGLVSRLRAGGLLGPAEDLRVAPFDRASLDALPLSVRSPAFDAALSAADGAWRLKTALVMSCGLLALLLVGLSLGEGARRRRFIELKSDFVSAVSHELRTPLASVRLLAETLHRRLSGEPRARDYPARIVRAVDGLALLVENILSFNRLDRGRWVARRAPVPLDELLATVREDLGAVVQVPVEWALAGLSDQVLEADEELLRLLLLNLARNACQYSARRPVRLAVTARVVGARLHLHVRDNGVGIPPQDRGRVFDEFYRVAGEGRARGSGLGLALCRRIMTLHGGTIRIAESGPEGTRFELIFPRGRS